MFTGEFNALPLTEELALGDDVIAPTLSRNASAMSTGSSRGLVISKPALEKIDSLISELQKTTVSDFLVTDAADSGASYTTRS
jgi:hypothetical protein